MYGTQMQQHNIRLFPKAQLLTLTLISTLQVIVGMCSNLPGCVWFFTMEAVQTAGPLPLMGQRRCAGWGETSVESRHPCRGMTDESEERGDRYSSDESKRLAYGCWAAGSTQPMTAHPIMSSRRLSLVKHLRRYDSSFHLHVFRLKMCAMTMVQLMSLERSRLQTDLFWWGIFSHFEDTLLYSEVSDGVK